MKRFRSRSYREAPITVPEDGPRVFDAASDPGAAAVANDRGDEGLLVVRVFPVLVFTSMARKRPSKVMPKRSGKLAGRPVESCHALGQRDLAAVTADDLARPGLADVRAKQHAAPSEGVTDFVLKRVFRGRCPVKLHAAINQAYVPRLQTQRGRNYL